MAMISAFIPIMLEIASNPALIVGGGKIAFRKASSIIEFGGKCFAISPQFCPEFLNLINKESIEYRLKKYEKGDIRNYKLVFCSTGDKSADKLVYDDAIANSALVNVADVPELCNFIMPAIVKRGDFIAAFSTQGIAPFYAKEQKKVFDKLLSPMLADITQLAGDFRTRVLNDVDLSSEIKFELFKEFLDINWEEILYKGGKVSAQKKIYEIFEKFSGNSK